LLAGNECLYCISLLFEAARANELGLRNDGTWRD
jgi:hypothetical protein